MIDLDDIDRLANIDSLLAGLNDNLWLEVRGGYLYGQIGGGPEIRFDTLDGALVIQRVGEAL